MNRERPGGQRQFGLPNLDMFGRGGVGGEGKGKPFDYLMTQIKMDVLQKPIRKEASPLLTIAQMYEAPKIYENLFRRPPYTPEGMTPADDMSSRLHHEFTMGKGTGQAQAAMERVQLAYVAHAYDALSPLGRYNVTELASFQHALQSNAEGGAERRLASAVTLEPQETTFLMWALDQAGIPHTLQPGTAYIDLTPLTEKIQTPDVERDLEGKAQKYGYVRVQEGYHLPFENMLIEIPTHPTNIVSGEEIATQQYKRNLLSEWEAQEAKAAQEEEELLQAKTAETSVILPLHDQGSITRRRKRRLLDQGKQEEGNI